MSELKAFNSERIYWAAEQVERVAGDIDELHLDDNLFYLKSEADKVIARNKYKWCLAMAMYCHNQREIYERDSYDWELEDDAKDTLRNKANIMRKWRKRWLKLAEKFKTNLTAQ